MDVPTQESPMSQHTELPTDSAPAIPAIPAGPRPGRTAKTTVLGSVGVGLLLLVNGVSGVGLLGAAAVAATLLTFGCWLFSRDPDPRALGAASGVALTLAGVSAVIDGATWQLVPWIALAAAVGAAAGYRSWRPRRRELRRSLWVRLVGLVGVASTVLVALIGFLGLLFDPVPDLPRPSGPFAVGSETYTWMDTAIWVPAFST